MYYDSTPVSTDDDKVSLFNKYFHSVFSTSSFVLPPVSSLSTPCVTLENLEITESEIFEVLSSLDPSKAPGPDGIGTNILKFCSTALCGPLHHLFTLCLSQANIPSEWRIHKIYPIHKSGDKASFKNYRPISLLSCISKILERIIYNKSIGFITETVISKFQFGFLSNRSSTQQLLLFLNSVFDSQSSQAHTDTIYLDLKKAFDKVSHPELLLKLWSSGITGNLWRFFQSYLTNRQQYVSINGHNSYYLPVISGVPQGSPLLFIIIIHQRSTPLCQIRTYTSLRR